MSTLRGAVHKELLFYCTQNLLRRFWHVNNVCGHLVLF